MALVMQTIIFLQKPIHAKINNISWLVNCPEDLCKEAAIHPQQATPKLRYDLKQSALLGFLKSLASTGYLVRFKKNKYVGRSDIERGRHKVQP